ncbi:hypothetical protein CAUPRSCDRAFT_12902, partial [Caulochytrium protostelioides]
IDDRCDALRFLLGCLKLSERGALGSNAVHGALEVGLFAVACAQEALNGLRELRVLMQCIGGASILGFVEALGDRHRLIEGFAEEFEQRSEGVVVEAERETVILVPEFCERLHHVHVLLADALLHAVRVLHLLQELRRVALGGRKAGLRVLEWRRALIGRSSSWSSRPRTGGKYARVRAPGAAPRGSKMSAAVAGGG